MANIPNMTAGILADAGAGAPQSSAPANASGLTPQLAGGLAFVAALAIGFMLLKK